MSNVQLNTIYRLYISNPTQYETHFFNAVNNRASSALKDEDACQSFLIGVWSALPIGDPSNFAAWLSTRLQWYAQDEFRKRQRKREVSICDIPLGKDDELSSDEERLSILADRNRNYSEDYLPDTEGIKDPLIRRVAKLLLDGFTQNEIAIQLNMRASTLRVKLMRWRDSQQVNMAIPA